MNADKRRRTRKAKSLRAKRSRAHNSTIKYWPIMFCPHEELYIAVSHDGMGKNATRKRKVDASAWQEDNSQFLPGYAIEMAQHKPGEVVKCPKCDHPIDFRTFPCSSRPKLNPPKT